MSPRFKAPGGPGQAAGASSSNCSKAQANKFYNNHNSGSQMKDIFGNDENSNAQQQQQQQQQRPAAFGGGVAFGSDQLNFGFQQQYTDSYRQQQEQEIEYPNPGSSASCDGCGTVVERFYHCMNCPEETGLFDLCASCWCARLPATACNFPRCCTCRTRALLSCGHVLATRYSHVLTPPRCVPSQCHLLRAGWTGPRTPNARLRHASDGASRSPRPVSAELAAGCGLSCIPTVLCSAGGRPAEGVSGLRVFSCPSCMGRRCRGAR